MNAVSLFTFQTPGHDITEPREPGEDYKAGGPFTSMVEYLG